MTSTEKTSWSVKLTPASRRMALAVAANTGLSVGAAAQAIFATGARKMIGNALYEQACLEAAAAAQPAKRKASANAK